MACWSFNRDQEDLHQAYENLSADNITLNAENKRLQQDREALRLQCESKQLEVQELTRRLREAAREESRLQVALERSAAEVAELKEAAAAAARQLEEAVREGRSFRQDNEMLLKRMDKMEKERAHQQEKVDRMTAALAMLEDVVNETLGETSATASAPSSARMEELRQSKQCILMELRKGPGGEAQQQPAAPRPRPRELSGSFEPRNNPVYESRVKLAPLEAGRPRSTSNMRYSNSSPRSPAGSPRKSTPRSGPLPVAAADPADVQVVLKDQKAAA
jgi:hypothetical protein